MVKNRNPQFHTIEQIVCANSGMSVQQLLNDRKDYQIRGLKTAAIMIRDGIRKHKKFFISGDYDVDGECGASILYMTLLQLGIHATVRLPKRFSEGYGLSVKAVEEFEDNHFLITVDNGITSFDAIRRAKEKGMTVIVTDHHLAAVDKETNQPVYPEADLLIDPNAIPNSADFNGYCGAGLAYKLAIELLGKTHPIIPKLTSLAAIATVADSVPLLYENRRIVKEGLRTMVTKEGSTMGLYALMCVFELDPYITTDIIGYKIAPALNASGRLYDDGAYKAFQLLTFDGRFKQAMEMAQAQLLDNEKRKELSDNSTESAIATILESGMSNDFPIVVYEPDAMEGIAGIIAGRISERLKTPCFLFVDSENPDYIKASARSYGGIHLKQLLDRNQSLLVKYGGHADAAGLTIRKTDLAAFRKALNDDLKDHERTEEDTQYYDIRILPAQSKSILNEILKFEPYGEKNPSPVILLEDLMLTPNGSSYYKFISNGKGVRLNSTEIDVISFSNGQKYTDLGFPRHVNLIGNMSMHSFMGILSPQFEFFDISACETGTTMTSLAQLLTRKAALRYGNDYPVGTTL